MKHTLQFSKIVFTAILFIFCSGQAHASGVGLSLGLGYENWDDDVNYSGDRQVGNIGFVYDTHVRRDRLFGYRLTLMREINDGGRLDMRGWASTHDFTFGLIRTKTTRFWVGPELKTSFYNKLTLNTNEQIVDDRLGDVWGIALGPAIGLNVHLPEQVSFSFSAAYLSGSYDGDTDYTTTSGKQYDDLQVNSSGLYLTVGLIFRTNE
jgi:hypothetical protein